MKKIIATAALLITLFVCHSQEAKQAKPLPQGKTFNLDTEKKDKGTTEVLTSNKAIFNGKTYPVYTGKRGGMYIKVMTATGKQYRKYIKQD